MPQLDKFTFAPQVFWLVVIFLVLYFLLVQEGLPQLYKVLLFRKRKLLNLNKSSTLFVKETFFSSILFNYVIINFATKLKTLPETFYKVLESDLDLRAKLYGNKFNQVNNFLGTSNQLDHYKMSFENIYFQRSKKGLNK